MAYGYHGRILRVNLSSGSIDVEERGETFFRKFLGGGALATHYLLSEIPTDADPLGSDNVLVVAPSVMVGAPLPGYSRFTVAAKSPLTGGFGEAEAGGFFGPDLKRAGFDAVVIVGQSPEPVYLSITNDQAALRSAAAIWGRPAAEAQQIIQGELGDSLVRVMQTGPAGERHVRYAAVTNGLRHFNGRTGMGAVMGSKRLRAVAVRGHAPLPLHDPSTVQEIAKWFASQAPFRLTNLGTAGNVIPLNSGGGLPTHNFREGVFAEAANISGERLKETLSTGVEGCWGCPVRCKRKVGGGVRYHLDPRYGGPEYEGLAALGCLCGVGDLEAITYANELCNTYVMDSISTGVCIAFAMECYEEGLLSTADADGLDLRFGNAEAMVDLVGRIGRREGLGDMLAEGVRRAAERIGGDAARFAIHVKGQECPLRDPRGRVGQALGFALSPTGADHLETSAAALSGPGPMLEMAKAIGLLEPVDPSTLDREQVRAFALTQHVWSLYNSLGLCVFTGFPPYQYSAEHITRAVRAVTGWDTSFYEILKVGERATSMARLFNMRHGLTAADDTLPARFFEPMPVGALAGERIDPRELRDAIELYYEVMGWDRKTGIPTEGKLLELGIDE